MGEAGGIYVDAGQYADALRCYNVALELEPCNVDFLIGRAGTLVSMGRSVEAIPDYLVALSFSPGDPDALIGRAIAWHELGQIRRMHQDLDEMRRMHRDTPGTFQGIFSVAAVDARERAAEGLARPIELEFD